MRRLLIGAAATLLLIAIAVTVARPPAVSRESMAVAVPTRPGSTTTLELDVALYTVTDTTHPAPALLLAHGFGSDQTALNATAEGWARRGYVVVSWSARGFGRSGGTIGLNDPEAEIADISALIDLLADRDDVVQDGPSDPRVGIAGGSYGGGAALLAAIDDDRLDAVVAVAAWNDLSTALAPNRRGGVGVPKAQWLSILFTAGGLGGFADAASGVPEAGANGATGAGQEPTSGSDGVGPRLEDLAALVGSPSVLAAIGPDLLSCGRFAPDLCQAYQESAAGDTLTTAAVDLLQRGSPAGRLDAVTAPTLLVQGQDDTLFDLGQSLANAQELQAAGVPTALRWIEAGHTGLGEIGSVADDLAAAWLDRWLPPAQVDPSERSDGPGDEPQTDQVFSWTDVASGEPQPATSLPPTTDESATTFALTPSGQLVAARAFDDPDPAGVQLVHPSGGLPAGLSTLPAIAAFGSFIPALDIPGQTVTFTTSALIDDMTLLGEPRLLLGAATDGAGRPEDRPPADRPPEAEDQAPAVFIKLYDVSPGGQTRLLGAQVNPTRLQPAADGADFTLAPVAHRVVAGNRLRLTITTTDQGFDTGTAPAIIDVPLGAGTRLLLPIADTVTAAPLPAAVRILTPVLLVLLGAVLASWVTRRTQHRLATTPPTADAPPVVIRGLAKRYADGKVAVDGIDLTVQRGQVFGLLGPNGAGKTTTMRMLLGLIRPTAGTVELLGQPVISGHPVFERVGVLVEGPGFAPYLTGRQNLESYWLAGGRPLREANLDRALGIADLGTAIDKPTRSYSHGMRQRLAIAQSLLGDPELLVLDEPTDGLDPEQIRAMRQLLARLGAQGITVLVSSHLLAEVEQMCTHVAVMQDGRVLATGSVADLMGATLSIVVVVDDQATARRALASVVDDDQVGVEGAGLVIMLEGTAVADIVQALVGAGVGVQAVTPRGRLEDTFLALTGARPSAAEPTAEVSTDAR